MKLEFKTSPFPINMQFGSSDVIEFLEFFQSASVSKESAFNTDNYYLIEYLWVTHYKLIVAAIILEKFIPYLLLILICSTGNSHKEGVDGE